jgi:tetratricopeptide (TPR) repeat protein
MERRFGVHARARRALIAALALASATASAAPKGAAAKKQFARGVDAYKHGAYAVAAEALQKSYDLEADTETLFALAQSERKLDRCELALPLYEKLLAADLPVENRKSVEALRDECRAIAVTANPAEPAPPAPAPAPAQAATAGAPMVEPESEPPSSVTPAPEGRPWYRDPLGDTFTVVGLVGLGAGAYYLAAGSSADSDKQHATTYAQFRSDSDRAHSDGERGVLGLAAGGALVAAGAIWYATHRGHGHAPVTGWLAPHGGGVGFARAF